MKRTVSKRTLSKRTLSKRKGGKKTKSMRRRQIMGGKGPLEKAVEFLREEHETDVEVIERVLRMPEQPSNGALSEYDNNILIIQKYASDVNPGYKNNIKSIAELMNNYIENKKTHPSSTPHSIYKRVFGSSGFKKYLEKKY